MSGGAFLSPEQTVGPIGRGQALESRPARPLPWRTQLDSGIRASDRTPTPLGPLLRAISLARGWRPKETPPLPLFPRHPVDKNSRARALGTVMGATCWPDVPGSNCQECGGPGAPAPPGPRRPRPGPAQTRPARHAYTAEFTFLRFPKSPCARMWVAGARPRSRSRCSPSRAHP